MNMTCEAKTEKEMLDHEAPTPNSLEELQEYISSLIEIRHDYGTCTYAMSLAATAAFNFVSNKFGVSASMASCAEMDFLRRTRRLNGPFIIIKAEDMLYPQYDLQQKLEEAMIRWTPWAAERATDLLESTPKASTRVIARWEELARQHKPTNTLPSEG